MRLQNTSLVACQDTAAPPQLPAPECLPPSYLTWGPASAEAVAALPVHPDEPSLKCPVLLLNSFTRFIQGPCVHART